MNISDAIKFISPAIEKKKLVKPVLNHVRITQGYAIAYNGMLALAAPIPLSLDCTPNGTLLKEAVKRFEGEFSATQKPNGDLFFKSGKFSVTIPCTTEDFPMPDFNGVEVLRGGAFVDKLKLLVPFSTIDELNPWQAGVLLRENKALATCGHTIAWCDVKLPPNTDLLVPIEAVKAMVEIGEEPEYIASSDSRFVAAYSGNRFLSCPLIFTTWQSLEKIVAPVETYPIPEGLFKAIKTIEPFGLFEYLDQIFIGEGKVMSAKDGTGASQEVVGLSGSWEWCHRSAKLIERHAKAISLNKKLGGWTGDGIQGRFQLRPVEFSK